MSDEKMPRFVAFSNQTAPATTSFIKQPIEKSEQLKFTKRKDKVEQKINFGCFFS